VFRLQLHAVAAHEIEVSATARSWLCRDMISPSVFIANCHQPSLLPLTVNDGFELKTLAEEQHTHTLSLSLSLSLGIAICLQIPVDIMEGMTDAQARQMAENLEFRGPARDEVSTSATESCECHVTFLIMLGGSVDMVDSY